MTKEIPIRCQGTSYIDISELQNFQGNLKELKESEFKKLKKSIDKYGFRFPVFVWNKFILDGHQRVFTINKMVQDGYSIGKIPIVEIEADSEKEAKQLVLLVSSRYGHVTDEGLYEFISMNELDWEELKTEIDLPEIDLGKFEKGYFDNQEEIKSENEFYSLSFTFLKDDAAYIQERLHRDRESYQEKLDEHWRERCLLRLLKKTV